MHGESWWVHEYACHACHDGTVCTVMERARSLQACGSFLFERFNSHASMNLESRQEQACSFSVRCAHRITLASVFAVPFAFAIAFAFVMNFIMQPAFIVTGLPSCLDHNNGRPCFS